MIIGLVGLAGSGKSTAARELVRHYGLEPRKFAAPLKDMMRQFLRGQGATEREVERMIEGDLKEQPTPYLKGSTPRYAMQTLGTDWGRALIHEDLWCDAAARSITRPTVFDDVRFENEAAAIRKAGGAVVCIVRPGVVRGSGHVSEDLAYTRHIVINDSTPARMCAAIVECWKIRTTP